MKKITKRLMLVLAIVATFVITKPVYAEDYDGNIKFITNIQRWSPANDLIFNNSKCSSAYLTDGDITYNLSCDGQDHALGFSFDRSDDDAWTNYPFKFETGKDVELHEVYHFSSSCSQDVCVKSPIDTIEANASLRLNIDNDDILDNSIIYESDIYSDTTFTVYYDYVYDDEDPSNHQYESGHKSSYYYIENNGKTDSVTLRTILLPIFYVKYDFDASGNTMPYGSWNVSFNRDFGNFPYTINDVNFTMDCNSNYSFNLGSGPSVEGTLITRGNNRGNYYSKLSYAEFSTLVDKSSPSTNSDTGSESDLFKVSYSGSLTAMVEGERINSSYGNVGYGTNNFGTGVKSSNRNVVASKGAYKNGAIVARKTENSDNNTYYYQINRSLYANASVPNGLFYTIIPFVILIAVAGAGIVIIKKKSVKA